MLVRAAFDRRIPVLGIYRGHQVINVALGGTLNQHIEEHMMLSENRTPDISRTHRVELAAGSGIRQILGVDEIETNSYHHQCIDHVAPGFRISGRAEDGTPEVIEYEDSRYACLGVQWHPEIHPNAVSLRIMRWFVDQLCQIER
jgi:gamma-glutamyl-gamma-aminobutyrate hydrolase PuuD